MRTGCALALIGVLIGLEPAAAQEWPTKTVKIIVPFGPGSTPDAVARLIGDRLQQKLGQAFVIENKPGASGNLGTDAVAKAEPDGATIGISIGGPLAINTLLFSKLPYDPGKDIAPITQLVTQPSALAINAGLNVNSVSELVELLKREPGKHNFGSIGNGSLSHLAMEAIALKSGVKLVHIPYAGSPQAMTALLRGDVQMACLPAISVTPHVGPGKVKILAVFHGPALRFPAGNSNAEGSRHRRRGGRVDGPDRTGRTAGRDDRQDQPGSRRGHQNIGYPGETRLATDGADRQLAGGISRSHRS